MTLPIDNHPPLFVITGEQGAGKSTFCQHLLTLAKEASWTVGGILSPPVFIDGRKIAIDVVALPGGSRRQLAVQRERPSANPLALGWIFDPAALTWGDESLRAATPCDLLIVDELGPLELERGEGWQSGIAAIESGAYKVGVVVIRPSLLDAVQRRWPVTKIIHIEAVEQAQPQAKFLFKDL